MGLLKSPPFLRNGFFKALSKSPPLLKVPKNFGACGGPKFERLNNGPKKISMLRSARFPAHPTAFFFLNLLCFSCDFAVILVILLTFDLVFHGFSALFWLYVLAHFEVFLLYVLSFWLYVLPHFEVFLLLLASILTAFSLILMYFGSILSGFSWILVYFGVFPPTLAFSHVIWRVFQYFINLFRHFNHPFVFRCSPFAPKLDKLHGPIRR